MSVERRTLHHHNPQLFEFFLKQCHYSCALTRSTFMRVLCMYKCVCMWCVVCFYLFLFNEFQQLIFFTKIHLLRSCNYLFQKWNCLQITVGVLVLCRSIHPIVFVCVWVCIVYNVLMWLCSSSSSFSCFIIFCFALPYYYKIWGLCLLI